MLCGNTYIEGLKNVSLTGWDRGSFLFMKRFSQTIKVVLALFVAVFANGTLSTVVAAATPPDNTTTNITEVVTPPEEAIEPQEVVPGTEPALPAAPLLMQTESQFSSFGWPHYPPQDTLVVPVEPTIKDICGDEGDQYTIPTVVGVEYWLEKSGPDMRLTDGQTYNTNGASSVTIIAKAKHGYVFANNKDEKSWKLNFSDKCTICHRTASVGNPYVQIEVDDSAINGYGNGDHYLEHTGPVFPAVGVDGKWGDIIPPLPGEHNGRNWGAGQTIYNNDCIVPVELEVTPGPCTYYNTTSSVTIDLSGTAKNTTLVVKNSSGSVIKEWEIKTNNDGNVTSPSLPVQLSGLSAGAYTVEVVSTKDGVIATSSFTIELCYYTATPQEPKKLDLCYGDKDKIYIRDTEGVIYKVNDVEMSGWVKYEGEALVITAWAAPGYVLDAEAIATWTFDGSDFTNEQCLTITKTGKVASDTNHDGIIGVGDTVTWEITVTNTSDSECESFYVTVDDENATLENEGYIGYLGVGEHKTLTATSIITVADLQACKVTNTVIFSGWRAYKTRDIAETLRLSVSDEESSPLATGSATAEYTLICPTPGSGSGGTISVEGVSTTVPATIPATGSDSQGNPMFIILASIIAYGATFFLQQRRSLYAAARNK